jgi:hypothetical protein
MPDKKGSTTSLHALDTTFISDGRIRIEWSEDSSLQRVHSLLCYVVDDGQMPFDVVVAKESVQDSKFLAQRAGKAKRDRKGLLSFLRCGG